MATHSSVLAWRIPGTAKPGGLLSMGSHRVGHDGSDLAAAADPNEIHDAIGPRLSGKAKEEVDRSGKAGACPPTPLRSYHTSRCWLVSNCQCYI